MTPNQPVTYQVDGETSQSTGFARNQLQVVDANEKPPSQELLKKQAANMQEATKELQQAIPPAMAKVVNDVIPKKKTTIQSYTPVLPENALTQTSEAKGASALFSGKKI